MLTKELSKTSRAQPVFIEPMQAVSVAELPDGGAWSYEAKLDGYRCLAAKRGSGVVLWSPQREWVYPLGFRRSPGPVRSCRPTL